MTREDSGLQLAETRAALFAWLRETRGIDLDALADPDERIRAAADLAEGALLGTEARRSIWTDADYLVAILALLTDSGRARAAALVEYARRPVE